MRDYELVLVVSPEGGEDGFPATVERVHNFITGQGGEVKNVDAWGRRRLAYPVERFTEGYYNITQFTIDPEHIRALENSLDLAEDVLRHLVVRLDEPIVVRAREEAEPAAQAPPGEPAAEVPSDKEPPAEAPAEEESAEAGEEEPAEEPVEAAAES